MNKEKNDLTLWYCKGKILQDFTVISQDFFWFQDFLQISLWLKTLLNEGSRKEERSSLYCIQPSSFLFEGMWRVCKSSKIKHSGILILLTDLRLCHVFLGKTNPFFSQALPNFSHVSFPSFTVLGGSRLLKGYVLVVHCKYLVWNSRSGNMILGKINLKFPYMYIFWNVSELSDY